MDAEHGLVIWVVERLGQRPQPLDAFEGLGQQRLFERSAWGRRWQQTEVTNSGPSFFRTRSRPSLDPSEALAFFGALRVTRSAATGLS